MATVGGTSARVLDRPELRGRIRSALDAGSLLLVADAGFGKTTALRDALDHHDAVAAWVPCADAGGDAGRLLELIIEAIRQTLPGAVDVLAERLTAAPEAVDPERAAGALWRELARLLVDPLVVCLDDAETLEASPAAPAVVARLIGSDGGPLRLAVASRRPLVTRLARQRAAGRVVQLGPAELAFSAADCEAYLRLAHGREPLPEEVGALMEETEGWPLGVVLAGATPEARGPSRALLADYFEEEVLGGMDAELRRRLLAAAMAPDLGVAQAAGFGLGDWRGLFLRVPGPDGGQAFHPLFRDFLRDRFDIEVPPEERRTVAARLADALEAAGRGTDAVTQRIASKDWEAVAGAVAREGPALVRRAPETVEAWLDALPTEQTRRPDLTLLAGQLAHGRGRLHEAVDHCRAAVAGFEAHGAPPHVRFAARFSLADAYLANRDFAGAAGLGATLDDPGAAGELSAVAVGALAGIGMALQGHFAEARAMVDRAFADPAAAPIRGQLPVFQGQYLDLPAGRLDDALLHVDQGLAVFEKVDPFGRLPYVLVFKLSIHEERGEHEEALALAARARDIARQTGLSGWVGAGTSIRIASLLARRGDVVAAEAELADVGPDGTAWGTWELEATGAVIAGARGDMREARAAAERSLGERVPWFDRMRRAAMLAPVLVRAGQPAQARAIVEDTLAERRPGFSAARLTMVLAWLLHEEGDEDGSVAALSAAWREAGDEARHAVRCEWPRVERPLWAALEHDALDPVAAVGAVADAAPDGAALGAFTRHPTAAVRKAALLAAVRAGHPEGVERLADLERDADPGVSAAARAAAERLRTSPPALAFRVLGAFELRRGLWVVGEAEWKRRVAARLVRLLLCRAGEPVSEDELIEAFWPEKPVAAGRRSLQVAVSAARAVLDAPGAESSRLAAAERSYRLVLLAGDSVDAHEFERAARAALVADGPARRPALAAAAELWRGDPLPEERYSDWATPWRQRLIDRYAQVLSALIDASAAAGDPGAAADVARRLVELDPLNEVAHRQLMVAYARAGRRGHALRQFLACRRALVAELGVEPGEETAALQRRVLAGEPV